MYKRFLDMLYRFGPIAAFLLVKVETKSLTKEDIAVLALQAQSTKSTFLHILLGNLEKEPDLNFLMRECMNGIFFDLDMYLNTQFSTYLEETGYSPEPYIWKEEK